MNKEELEDILLKASGKQYDCPECQENLMTGKHKKNCKKGAGDWNGRWIFKN